jgi:hypothetical protein
MNSCFNSRGPNSASKASAVTSLAFGEFFSDPLAGRRRVLDGARRDQKSLRAIDLEAESPNVRRTARQRIGQFCYGFSVTSAWALFFILPKKFHVRTNTDHPAECGNAANGMRTKMKDHNGLSKNVPKSGVSLPSSKRA